MEEKHVKKDSLYGTESIQGINYCDLVLTGWHIVSYYDTTIYSCSLLLQHFFSHTHTHSLSLSLSFGVDLSVPLPFVACCEPVLILLIVG